MIIVRFTSGLGNQMFQYNFYRLLKEHYGDTPVKADLTWFYANDDHHGYELQRIFGTFKDTPFFIEEATGGELLRVTGLLPNLLQPSDMVTGRPKKGKATVHENSVREMCTSGSFSRRSAGCFERFRRYPNRILREFTQKKREPYVIDQMDHDRNKTEGLHKTTGSRYENACEPGGPEDLLFDRVMNLDTSKDWYIRGFWIEERYVLGREDFIHDHFRFPDITEEKNLKLAERIKDSDSVSIHVRRGDYLSEIYKDSFISLGREYYEKAAAFFMNRYQDPLFFIFSDDPDFVEKEFGWLKNKVIVSGNDGEKAFRDMQLMSLCKSNIIANSTFSQWGALLNRNEGHITIYPSVYLKDRDNEIKKMSGWIRT